ncbi:Spy/CpxP family protein refolding chaperone [Ideonella sp.]|uniref:Spy/CpxP family protein refolding chaperone n=1 Tax=Ideonella sp. TaxID=1929293 RepID=UPI002B4A8449|nr:Spy/CpxP family protein refolding chaperone [Ideonella sp.]HJV71639.1 Spy/CpxP family protein refolding chaperone [Ideonella sp.]
MRTWIKNTLIAALGASVALGSLAFANSARMGGCGWHAGGPMSEADAAKWRDKIIDRATSELSLDANQRQNLVALADTLHSQRQAMMGGSTNPREQLQALFAGDKFDAARAQSLVQDKTEALRTASPAVIAAISTFYDGLRPEQQQKLRDFMARGGHHGWHGANGARG